MTGWVGIAIVSVMALTACRSEPAPAASNTSGEVSATPAEFADGETLFTANCARCHGEHATGTNLGPPLVHKIYEPGHHADASFHLAVRGGVRPHHWQFGPMPPIQGLGEADVNEIIGYVRWRQRQSGIP